MKSYLQNLRTAHDQLDLNAVQKLCNWIRNAPTIYLCGNGGSAALASHMAIDLQKACDARAIALNNMAVITAIGNDRCCDDIFAAQLEVLAKQMDLVIGISASGASQNIINAIDTAKAFGCGTAVLTGNAGDDKPRPLHTIADHGIVVDSDNYGIVEDVHCSIMHIVCEELKA